MTHRATHPDLTHAIWRRSSHSNTQGNQCVEIAAIGGIIAVRDSKNPDGDTLTFNRAHWATFMTSDTLSHTRPEWKISNPRRQAR